MDDNIYAPVSKDLLIYEPPWLNKEDDSKNFHKRTRIDSFICKGTLFSIITVFIRSTRKNKKCEEIIEPFYQTHSLIVLKHDPEKEP